MSWFRRYLCNMVIKWNGFFLNLILGTVVKYEERDVDYSKWLGPNYKSQPKPHRCSTYVCNHSSISDAFSLGWALEGNFAFFGGAFIKNFPLIRDCVTGTEGVFVPREGDQKLKNAFVEGMI